jgi:hypothetical protein
MKLLLLSLLMSVCFVGCMPGSVRSDQTPDHTNSPILPTFTETPQVQDDKYSIDGEKENEVMNWDQAVSLILLGKVKQVVQFHDLTVILVLDDETMIETAQPEIDEVIRVIDLCGEKCAEITILTE